MFFANCVSISIAVSRSQIFIDIEMSSASKEDAASFQHQPFLFTIPIELQQAIVDLLPLPTLQLLHATHRRFRDLINLKRIETVRVRRERFDELVTAVSEDRFLKSRNLHACKLCLRLRHQRNFTKKVTKKKPDQRFCIDCGLRPKYNLYNRGSRIDTAWQKGVICVYCHQLKRGYDADQVGPNPQMCRECGESGYVQPERVWGSRASRRLDQYCDDFMYEDYPQSDADL